MIVAPVSYQGGKQRLAKKIINIINPKDLFYLLEWKRFVNP
jgi:site-specific DNA-adenine methylase